MAVLVDPLEGVNTSALLQYATSFREAVLQGTSSSRMCAAISGPLGAVVDLLGVGHELVQSDLGVCDHIFLRLADGQVLDATADQFNWCSREALPGVYLGPGRGIHQNPRPWPGGQEWRPLMLELRRLYPSLDATDVGFTVGITLRTLPGGLCDFAGQ